MKSKYYMPHTFRILLSIILIIIAGYYFGRYAVVLTIILFFVAHIEGYATGKAGKY